MEKLFVYGTLKDKQIQRRVFGRADSGVKDALEGYATSKAILDGFVYSILVKNSKCSVKGSLISVTKDELRLIDKYETDIYTRVKVTLRSGKKVWTHLNDNS